jgi:hypothetical protein
MVCISEEMVVQEDFENMLSEGWESGTLDYSYSFTNFLGRFGKGNAESQKTYCTIPTDVSFVTVDFDFYKIDSGDPHTDRFYTLLDGVKLDLDIYGSSHDEGRKSGSAGGISWESQIRPAQMRLKNYGHSDNKGQIHHVKVNVPAPYIVDGTLTLKFQALMYSSFESASVGIDNIKIIAHRECQCEAIETNFDTPCNHGSYGADNIAVLSGTGDTVSFSLMHSFGFDLHPLVVWMENPYQRESPYYCSQHSSCPSGSPFGTYVAKCTNGWARIGIQAGSGNGSYSFEHFVELEDPFCQDSIDFPAFNPQKRCYWEFYIPCSCEMTPPKSATKSDAMLPTNSPTRSPNKAPITPLPKSPTKSPTKSPNKAPTRLPTKLLTKPLHVPLRVPTWAWVPTNTLTKTLSRTPVEPPTKPPTNSPVRVNVMIPMKTPTWSWRYLSRKVKFDEDLVIQGTDNHGRDEVIDKDRGSGEGPTTKIEQPLFGCENQSKVFDAISIPVDKCISRSNTQHAVKILSQDGDTVFFSVMQKWKGCNGSGKLSWVATDFVGINGELTCATETDLDCGLIQKYTADCEKGMAVIDLFTQDEMFGQTDGSSTYVPRACNASGDTTKICHFRYVLQCKPSSLCKTQSTGRRLGSSDKSVSRD